MTGTTGLLDPERVRQLFDLANHVQGWNGGDTRPIPTRFGTTSGNRPPSTREPSTPCQEWRRT